MADLRLVKDTNLPTTDHSLDLYRSAKSVYRELPKLVEQLKKNELTLAPWHHLGIVGDLLKKSFETRKVLETHINEAREVLLKKGIFDAET
jgi:hypothetical protein